MATRKPAKKSGAQRRRAPSLSQRLDNLETHLTRSLNAASAASMAISPSLLTFRLEDELPDGAMAAGTVIERTTVTKRLDDVHQHVSELEDTVEVLAKRLHCVMLPGPPRDGSGADGTVRADRLVPESVSGAVIDLDSRIGRLIGRVNDLYRRLEV